MTHEQAFMAAIIEAPADDTPRLVFADWLDEQVMPACTSCTGPGRILDSGNEWKPHPDCKRCRGTGRVPDGRAARAEFVRVQVELARYPRAPAGLSDGSAAAAWKERREALRRRERELIGKHGHEWAGPALPFHGEFRRGLVAEVSLSTEAFCGGVCPKCFGMGSRRVVRVTKECVLCKGSKRTPGAAAALFSACPIEWVTLADLSPAVMARDLYVWWFQPEQTSYSVAFSAPPKLKPFLDGEPFQQLRGDASGLCYPTPEAAHAAMSDAACAFGRAAAKEGK